MEQINLIPIMIYLSDKEGLDKDDLLLIEDVTKDIYKKTKKFSINLEIESENNNTIGLIAPVDCLSYLLEHDEIIDLFYNYGFDELVSFIYWESVEQKFYVKHPYGDITEFNHYIKTIIKTDEILNTVFDFDEILNEFL
jgi:hypothetical protein